MSEAAKEAQRRYLRDWRKKNPEKAKEQNRRNQAAYWERKAQSWGLKQCTNSKPLIEVR